jgi:hypothetical protein
LKTCQKQDDDVKQRLKTMFKKIENVYQNNVISGDQHNPHNFIIKYELRFLSSSIELRPDGISSLFLISCVYSLSLIHYKSLFRDRLQCQNVQMSKCLELLLRIPTFKKETGKMLKTMEQFAKRLQYSKSLISLLWTWYLFYVTNIIAD